MIWDGCVGVRFLSKKIKFVVMNECEIQKV